MELGGFDTRFKSLEDWDFVLRMLMIGNGYKIKRLDYAVNINNDHERISNNDFIGYMQLADKYRKKFGEQWFSLMFCMSHQRKGSLTLYLMIRMSMAGKTMMPVKIYIKDKLTSLPMLHHLYKRFTAIYKKNPHYLNLLFLNMICNISLSCQIGKVCIISAVACLT